MFRGGQGRSDDSVSRDGEGFGTLLFLAFMAGAVAVLLRYLLGTR